MPEPVVDEKTAWQLLGEPRRHRVLRHLDAISGATTMAGVAETIIEDYDGDRDRLELELRHVDVPKLADAGVVEYDPDRDRIEPTDRVEPLCDALDAVEIRLQSPTEIR